jgi:hypothetical protein
LLLALARAVDIEAHAMLIASDRQRWNELLVPSWKYFDHVVACLRVDERIMCGDPTDPELPFGELPMWNRNAVILPIVPGQTPSVFRFPNDENRFAWQVEVDSINEIGCDGSVVERLSRGYDGPLSGIYRALLRQPAAEQQRWLETDYAATMGDEVKPKISVRNLDQRVHRLLIDSETRFPGSKALASTQSYGEPDHWLGRIAKDFRSQNKHHDLVTNGLRFHSKLAYRLCPDAYLGDLGPELELESKFGSLRRRYEKTGNGVTVESTLELLPQTVPVKELPDFNRFIDIAIEQSRIWFGLKQRGVR